MLAEHLVWCCAWSLHSLSEAAGWLLLLFLTLPEVCGPPGIGQVLTDLLEL